MGDVLMGSTKHKGNVSMLTPEQESLLKSTLQGLGPQYQQALGQFLQPQSMEDLQAAFDKSYVEPAKMAYERNVLPSIQERFIDQNAGSSSALNQALSQSAADLSTMLGTQFGQFMQGQKQNQLQALGLFNPLMQQQTFSPLIQQQQGLIGPLLQALASIGTAAAGAV